MGWWNFLNTQDQETQKSEPTIIPISSQTGIYFDEMGQMLFYTTQWKVVNYANLKPVQIQWKQVKEHQSKITEYCSKTQNQTWYYLTECHAFASYMRSKLKYVDQLRDIIFDYLSLQPVRVKRGILDFGGDLLKFLFETLTQSDAKNYNKHIRQLEDEKKEILHI
jgi:hypothetical protein